MKLPKQQRTEYQNNILFEVIFQARFPRIMKISNEQPVNFQDQIRKKGFPETKIKKLDFPAAIPITEQIRKAVSGLGDDEYMFFSEDGKWQITLTKDFVALQCTGYRNYTEFEERLRTTLGVFWQEYEPNYFNRIGLRYRNLANKNILVTDRDIREFVPLEVAPELQESTEDEIKVKGFEKLLVVEDGTSTVNVRYIYGEISGKYGIYNLNDEESYIIDIDCYTTEKKRKVEDAIITSRTFNQGNIRNIFQRSITDTLREVMGPISEKN